MKRAFFLAIVIAGLLNTVVPASSPPPPPDALKFFKNYFVTGDYVVGGVGLRNQGVGGIATGWIRMSGAPEDAAGNPTADILAAFLYWQAVTKDGTGNAGVAGATFGPWKESLPSASSAGIPLNTEVGPLGKILGTGTPPCWSSGGGTGSSGGAHLTYTYRTDVLRFLDIDDTTGKYRVNGYYQVQVPDGVGVAALGASLVVIYRDPAMPLNAIVMYEGGVTIDNSNRTWSLDVNGFYQPADVPYAKITYLVGSGQSNKYENVSFSYYPGGLPVFLDPPNPFWASNGANWDSPSFTVNLGPSPNGVSHVTTTVDTTGLAGSDCLTVSGVLFKTAVLDTDGDGLLNVWEDWSLASSEMLDEEGRLVDPYGQPLPNLAAMGATPDRKDVFIEVGYMYADGIPSTEELDGTVSYGGVPKPAHSHLPTAAAIKLMGGAFKNAPVDCDPSSPHECKGIKLHIDAGPSYPPCTAAEIAADECYIVPAALARGGEALDESSTPPACTRDPATDPVWTCLFHDYPGTVGWKTGFRYIRDELINNPPPLATLDSDDPCDVPGNLEVPPYPDGYTCERRFDRNRHDMFHYAFLAHAVGMPKSVYACLDKSDPAHPVEIPDIDGRCPAGSDENPAYFEPRTNSGIGDFPGGDILVTLGAFSDRYGWPGGTDFMVASTFMHELGHNIELRHGAWQETDGGPVLPAPNCIPTYLSVMNYLYQLRGLLDNAGTPHLDFSSMSGPTTAITESSLSDGPLSWPALFTPTYRIGWYTPWQDSYLEDPVTHLPRTTVAGRHCDGSPKLATEPEMVRIDAPTAAGDIDWNANGNPNASFEQDVNFNGRTVAPADGSPELPTGFNDWANIHLNQIGARRNIGAPYLDELGRKAFGPLSADLARLDWARLDWARLDWARLDWARLDWAQANWGDQGLADVLRLGFARLDWAQADLARLDWARLDWARLDWARAEWGGDDGRGDYGGGDMFLGDPNNPGGCLDHETATLLANTPPYEFRACRLGVDPGCTGADTGIRSDWTATNEGAEKRYFVYYVDVEGTALAPGQKWVEVGTVAAAPGVSDYSFFGNPALVKNHNYLFFGVAEYERTLDGQKFTFKSEPSNLVPIVGPNHAPVANGQSVTLAEDTPTAITLTGSDDDDGDALTYTVTTPPANGTLSGTPPSLTYTPAPNYYGPDAFTFSVSDGTGTSTATVIITVTPVNDAPVAVNDSYPMPTTGSVLTVPARGVLANDTDIDSPVELLTAVPFSGPTTRGTLVLNTDGSFVYTPNQPIAGSDSFTYRVSDGFLTSNVATVRITAYALFGVQNVPPATISKTKAGSSIPMKWQFKDGPVVVNSSWVGQRVTVKGGSVNAEYRNTDPGSSSFRYDTTTNTWYFNLQTKDTTGVYSPGEYWVTITPTTDDSYLPSPPFKFTLTK